MSEDDLLLDAARGGMMLTGSLARNIVEPQLDLLTSSKALDQGHAQWQEVTLQWEG